VLHTLVGLLLALSACSLSTEAIVDTGSEPGDGGMTDGRPHDAPPTDTAPDAPPRDTGDPDTSPPGPCPPDDTNTIALYTFDADSLVDDAGGHDGTSLVTPQFQAGRMGCGRALYFAPTVPFWMEVEDSDDFELTEGSIDFWARIDERPPVSWGLLSRDSTGRGDGHITIFVTSDGRIVVRQQTLGDQRSLCTEPDVTDAGWIHVVYDFGPPSAALYVDGVPATSRDTVSLLFDGSSLRSECSAGEDWGIAGTPNPMAIGGSTANTNDGGNIPITESVLGGALDHVRISSVRRGP